MTAYLGMVERLEQLKYELSAEMQRGALQDHAKVEELRQQIRACEQDIETEERKKMHEQRLDDSHSEIAYILDELNIDGVTMRQFCNGEQAYQILRVAVQQIMMERDEERLSEITALQSKHQEYVRTLLQEKAELQRDYDEMCEANADLRKQLTTVNMELEETARKRDAAATEIDRLNSHIDDLRKEAAVGAKEAVKVIDTNMNSNLSDMVKKWKDSRPAIYNKQPLDNLNKRYRAVLAETDEEIEFSYLEAGKYREVNAEEAETFRREAEERKRDNENTALVESDIPAPVIPSDDCTADGLDEEHVSVEVAGKADQDVIKRLEALEVAVFGFKNGEAA